MSPLSQDERERLERMETKLDDLTSGVGDLRVAVEHRVTKLEVKAGVYGLLGGGLITLVNHLLSK